MKRTATVAAVLAIGLLAAGCGNRGFQDPDPPLGSPTLPDIVPSPPEHVQMIRSGSRWLMQFSSVLVNIGKGDFILRAKRDPATGEWRVEQVIAYSKGGAAVAGTPARLVWGGDGHNHWHVQRVAVNTLVRRAADGKPSGRVRTDSKVGFCFYDFVRYKRVPTKEPHYESRSCGTEGDRYVGMGLSVGWADVYALNLPGQTIDVTDVPDGPYRLIADVDKPGWFRELDVRNNTTWVDIDLSTRDGLRFAKVVGSGPDPGKRVVPLPHPETS